MNKHKGSDIPPFTLELGYKIKKSLFAQRAQEFCFREWGRTDIDENVIIVHICYRCSEDRLIISCQQSIVACCIV